MIASERLGFLINIKEVIKMVNWLKKLKVKVPITIDGINSIKIGYREYEGIYLKLIAENGRSQQLAHIKECDLWPNGVDRSELSKLYMHKCRSIARDEKLISEMLESYLGIDYYLVPEQVIIGNAQKKGLVSLIKILRQDCPLQINTSELDEAVKNCHAYPINEIACSALNAPICYLHENGKHGKVTEKEQCRVYLTVLDLF